MKRFSEKLSFKNFAVKALGPFSYINKRGHHFTVLKTEWTEEGELVIIEKPASLYLKRATWNDLYNELLKEFKTLINGLETTELLKLKENLKPLLLTVRMREIKDEDTNTDE